MQDAATTAVAVTASPWAVASFVGYLLVVIGIGVFSARFSSEGVSEFFVGGQKKYTASSRFRLPGGTPGYDLEVKPGSRGIVVGGYVLMISSIVAATFMGVGPILVDMPKRPHAVGLWAGAGLVGAFGLGGGIAMMVLGKTKVKIHPRGR